MIKNPKILIVDDEPRMCKSLKTMLSTQSYDVQTCYSGNEALNSLAKNKYDLVLQDVFMEAMDGFQVFNNIKNQKINTPVIIMTGNASTDTAIKALRMGACDYLKKPFESHELFSSVKKALDRKIVRQENQLVKKKLHKSEKKYKTLKNVFDQKIQVQKVAAEKKKLALISQVAGKMAHDFNNVLAIIMGNAQLGLLDSKEIKTRKALELIFQQTLRGKNLTKNLIAFARTQEPEQQFFKINGKIELVVKLMKKDLKKIKLIKEEKPEIPELFADPGMIEHTLVNIIQNSIHALSMIKHPTITIRTYKLDNNLCLEIEDNGCGIPKEYIQKIYEPAFTLKGMNDITQSYKRGIKGTGYGMANVKKYIGLHKGTILVTSDFGAGTKITITLPIIQKKLTGKDLTALQDEKIQSSKYILLVEDEHSLSDIQYKMLSRSPCNHKVDIAVTGKVAMDLFDGNKYDFISLDYILPNGINGMDVYNHIRKSNKNIPILFVSGNIEFLESIKELKQKDGNIDHISKPCQNKAYLSSVNKLLEKTISSH
jgi:two-component system, cell cycle sensor histidine kinase and response regulator CckA